MSKSSSEIDREIEKLRQELQEKEKEIDQLRRDRSEYLRISAHQLKSPLASISFSVDTLLKEYAGRLNWKQLRIIEAIKHSTESLNALITDILELERLKSEKPEFEYVNIVDICSKVIDDLKAKAQEKELSFNINLPAKQLITKGLRFGLRQAIYNLVENAIKYSHPRGIVEITVGYDEVEKSISLIVRDYGIGIPEKEKEKIFEEFYRASNARKYEKSGTGFGMAIIKRVVELCNGEIALWSKEGEGTKITVKLPLVKGVESEKPSKKKEEKKRKIVVVGGVAAGPKAASRARRLDPEAEITLFEKGYFLAYAGCALTFYISGLLKRRRDLTQAITGYPDPAEFFRKVKKIDVKNLTEVIKIDRENKKVVYKDLMNQGVRSMPYDVLILATGGTPIVPEIRGIDLGNIFYLRGVDDAERIKHALINEMAREVIVLGGGLIGVEIADALTVSGARVTIVEKKDQILPFLDPEMAALVEKYLDLKGVRVLKNQEVIEFEGDKKVKFAKLRDRKLPAELVIIAVGIKPNVELAREAGLTIGETGAISVNQYLQTNDPDIYAAGDCVESWHAVFEKPFYLPLGSIANRQGRVAGSNAAGLKQRFGSVSGTIIIKVFDCHVAKTGLNEREAKEGGFDPVSCHVPEYDRERFIPGAEIISIKLIACKKSKRLIGAQIVGRGEVAKRIDLASTIILKRGNVNDLIDLDLGYAPYYSNAMGALVVAANVLQNKLNGYFDGITSIEAYKLINEEKDKYTFIDVRPTYEYDQERIPGFDSIPLETLRDRVDEIPRNKPVIVTCESGARAYQALLILKEHGFENVKILEGGLRMWPYFMIRE